MRSAVGGIQACVKRSGRRASAPLILLPPHRVPRRASARRGERVLQHQEDSVLTERGCRVVEDNRRRPRRPPRRRHAISPRRQAAAPVRTPLRIPRASPASSHVGGGLLRRTCPAPRRANRRAAPRPRHSPPNDRRSGSRARCVQWPRIKSGTGLGRAVNMEARWKRTASPDHVCLAPDDRRNARKPFIRRNRSVVGDITMIAGLSGESWGCGAVRG